MLHEVLRVMITCFCLEALILSVVATARLAQKIGDW